jgi:hypothetical protein
LQLNPSPEQEAKWQEEIRASQLRFKARVEEALKFRSNMKHRKEVYARWRQEVGDAVARESAKYVEAYIKGQVEWPRWFNALKSG